MCNNRGTHNTTQGANISIKRVPHILDVALKHTCVAQGMDYVLTQVHTEHPVSRPKPASCLPQAALTSHVKSTQKSASGSFIPNANSAKILEHALVGLEDMTTHIQDLDGKVALAELGNDRDQESSARPNWVDQMGNLHGRVDGANASAEALLIGSHMDTVIDAGIFDGSLGIVSAISALKVLHINGKLHKLRRPVEVIAFSDEEGVRFQTTFLGSGAIAGILPATTLGVSDKRNVTIESVLKDNSLEVTEESFLQLKYDSKSVWGYVELHIEQGPVLEQVGFPLGVVKGIAGQTRLKVTVRGSQGHAGTVPMSMRQDPMAAAAELIVLMESVCKNPEKYLSYDEQCSDSAVKSLSSSLVCTVGEISTWPSASNVIPGQARVEYLKCC
ncbi:hypothetical protein TanjilG_21403 [Lupinus angustifolius]|uniref:Peptidase M20 dimerisation domain-containing protein n=1 Tax=Lupinus angustifolius TaxID=3871 RepID=A0A4P1RMR8_LUPAN|nr:hypothetical protein TanjilG_21403 [Lupinus angustifolius]